MKNAAMATEMTVARVPLTTAVQSMVAGRRREEEEREGTSLEKSRKLLA